ncbi:MAG: ABC transporter permease [Xanthomonadales bacterium]|nr:ABC transporter permease [Gammaproteobacteria bacterium]MBT8064656.1 ABC transporter permease [Gammaproteobacteria bacterium]NNJ64504.1 ABC transporter permease [Xanthomonadales bacterium]NNK32086.1 ABC transporter permease [Xanthomonadales bacterium]NNK38490.1 ABC transporter permease [Xanthomonadales bacterium]
MPGRGGTWSRLRRNRSGMAGLAIVLVFLLLAAGVWTGLLGQDWSTADGGRWEPAGREHWFGTNLLGQDIFQRAVYSVRTAFEIGLVVAVLSTLLGAVLGALAGWYSDRWVDSAVLWLKGVLDSIPFYLFVAAVAYALQGQPWAMHLAMVATFWTTTGRLVRAEVMKLKTLDFVLAARAIGLPAPLILLRHLLPNTVHLLLVQGSIAFVAAIKTEVILSFLGLGVQDGVSWGLMLAESTQEVLAGHFNNFLSASLLLFALLLGFNLLTDAMQDALDPREASI